jgi:hypothetical protein
MVAGTKGVLTAKASLSQPAALDHPMTENGFMVKSMAMVLKLGRMERCTRADLKTIRRMERAS